MVEMLEANYALTNATDKSLILLDEIGRGTSTYDGMALAQAIVEYIHEHIQAKTLFSTHYHELTALEDELEHVKNIHVRAEEFEDKIVFLHKVEDGRANESYGIHVAKLAELPDSLIERAKVILKELEQQEQIDELDDEQLEQLTFFPVEEKKDEEEKLDSKEMNVIRELKQLNLLEMTPLDALNKLYALQKKVKK